MSWIVLLLWLLYAVLFGVPVGQSTTEAWIPIAGADYDGVIVPGTEAAEFAVAAGWTEGDDFWTPSADDVAALEGAFDAAWAADPGAVDGDYADPSEHLRQYVGVVSDGERLIHVNGFCDPLGTDWRTEPVLVADGGACFYQAIWSVDSAEFLVLSVNGEA